MKEKLRIVNEQLREKINQLQQVNNDLENFFASANIPIIFLDTDLALKRYTPAAGQLFSLTSANLGEPLSSLSEEYLSEDIINEAREVMRDSSCIRKEVVFQNRYFLRQVSPYYSETHEVNGITIVFHEITEIHRLSIRAADRERQHAAVAELGMLAMSGMDVQDFMNEVVRQVASTLRVDLCKILKYTPESHSLLMMAGIGWKKGLVGKAHVSDAFESQAGYTLKSGEPVIVKRLSTETRFSGPSLLIDHEVISGLSCVINHIDVPYGVFGVHTKTYREFTQDDANFIRSICTLLSSVLREREIQEKLYKSEQQFRSMANSIPQLAWMTDQTGYIFWYNQRWFEYTGTTFEEMKGMGWTKVHHPDYSDKVVKKFMSSIVAGQEWEDIFPLRSKDGEYRWFLSRARPIKNNQGVITHWFGTNTDINEQLEIEKALSESEEKLRIAKDSNKLGAYEYYIQTEVTVWDDLIKDIWGLDRDETPTQEIYWNGIHPDDKEKITQALERSIDTAGDGHFHVDYRVINRKTGDISWIEGSGQVSFEKGIPLKMIGMVIDITDRKNLENSLQQAVNELEKSNAKKNEFLATLGHELRNPLASISGGIQLLQLDHPDSEELTIMANGVDLMASLLDDLLDLSRIERGIFKLHRENVNLSNILRNVVRSFQSIVSDKKQDLHLSMSDTDVYVHGDRTRLEQIFSNLLSNANKFTNREGEIQVSLKLRGENVIIDVQDSGIGIVPGMEQRIFDPFEQITSHIGNKGLGIGLSLVRQFVKLHDGSIEVESKGLDTGAKFTVSIPFIQQSEGLNLNNNETNSAIKLKKDLRVLIVDDNVDAVRGLKALLQKANCKTEVAYTANESLRKLHDFDPEVFILDIGLPDMDGHSLIREIKNSYSKHAIYIAHTGYGHNDAQELSKASGFDFHLNKPVKFDELLSILRAI